MLPVAMARSTAMNTLCTSGFVVNVHTMERMGHSQRKTFMSRAVCQVAAPGEKSAVIDCILVPVGY